MMRETMGGAAERAGLDRRALLRGGACAGLAAMAGCAAPAPEQAGIDPDSLIYPPPPADPRYRYDRTLIGSSDVEETTEADRLRQFATGESARGQGFSKPFDVVAHEGRVYVSDTVSRTVHALDFPGRRYHRVGGSGVGRLAKPLGMDADDVGHLYVVDGTAKRLVVYDRDGGFVTAMGDEEMLSRPTGVAVTPDGQRIHVLDTGGVSSAKHRVVVYDPSGAVIEVIGRRGAESGEFNLPLDCCLDAENRLYVVDTGNFRVQVFDPDGRFDHEFGEAGRFPGQFGHPKGIDVGPDGVIYVTDTLFGVFQLFNQAGQILMSIGLRREAPGPAHFLLPAGLSVDVDGRIYVVDQFYRKVEVFRPIELPAEHPIGQMVA